MKLRAPRQKTPKRQTPKLANRVHELMQKQLAERPALAKAWDESKSRRDLSAALGRLRRQAKLTQEEVARAAGWDQSFVSKLESATGPWPTQATLQKFAEACQGGVGLVFYRESKKGVILEGSLALGTPRVQRSFERALGKLEEE